LISENKIAFLRLFVFLIPFQRWQLFGNPYTNATFIVFFIYVALSLYEGRHNFRIVGLVNYIWPIGIVISLMLAMTIKNNFEGSTNAFSEIRQLIMQLVFLVLLANDIARNVRLEIELIFAFIFGMIAMSIFYFLGIGIEITGGRTTIFDINSNTLAFWFALAILLITRLNIEKLGRLKRRQLFLLLIPPFLYISTLTGSRGALIALMAGLVFYLIFLPMQLNRKLPIILMGFLVLAIGTFLLLQTEIVQQRIQQELLERNFGGRKAIWELTLLLIQKNIWWGAGASGFERYLLDSLGKVWSPHNEYLLVLSYTGLIGFLFFVFFLLRILIVSIELKSTIKTSFYLSIVLVFLIHFYTSGGFITSFTCWFFLALIVGLKNALKPAYYYTLELRESAKG
jgi:O-antigen ligase